MQRGKHQNCVVHSVKINCATWHKSLLHHWNSRQVSPCHQGMARPQVADGGTASSVKGSLRINNQQDASTSQNFILSRNSTCFGHLLYPSSGVISCTRGNWYVSCRLCGRCLGQSGPNLTLLESGHITCMKHTNLPRVQLITPDDGYSRCPKHVEFRDKIKILDT
jgi:hypothetical protein